MFESLPSNNLSVVIQIDLRDRETAAAVEDLEVRQMELEAQRRRLEQVKKTSHSAFLLLSLPPLWIYFSLVLTCFSIYLLVIRPKI